MELSDLAAPHTRRTLLATSGAGLVAAALAACGGSSRSGGGAAGSSSAASTAAGPVTGTIQFSNYPGWIGSHTIADFHKTHPQANVHVDSDESTFASLLPKIKAQPGIYDLALASTYEVQRAVLLGVAAPLDFASMPNTKLIASKFLTTPVNQKAQYFVPTDYGKYAIGLRTDMVSEPVTSWKDVFALAPKYSGRMYWYDFPKDIITAGLLALGYPANDSNQTHIMAAGKKLESIKHAIGNLGTNGIAAALVNGSAAISVSYDYDVYAAAQKNKKIKWIVPSEGVPAYLEGWVALKGGIHLSTVQAFMNYALTPHLYADFISENDAAGVMPSANTYLPKALTTSEILFPPPDVLKRVYFLNFVGEAESYYDQAYTAFKAA
jgi:spermidine/putrescine-binding protein